MGLEQIRSESIRAAKQLGVVVPPVLPLLEAGLEMRNTEEITSRLLVMNAVAAIAYGFDKAKAIAWINQEELLDSLSKRERQFIFAGVGRPDRFKLQIEGMWGLAWSIKIVDEQNFASDCDDAFVTMFPNLKQSQKSTDFRMRASPRAQEEVIAACDLAYCLHWAIRHAEQGGKCLPATLKPYVVIERRRALEWLLSNDTWDEIQLDT